MKNALCIKRDYNIKTFEDIEKADLYLLPRDGVNGCEENEDFWQLLPYCVIIAGDPKDGADQILTYKRGSSGGESRLISKYSMGFGGHVDLLPPDDIAENALSILLASEAARELDEEIGLQFTDEAIVKELAPHLKNNSYLIIPNEDSVGVDKHHLGIVAIFCIPREALGEIEEGHIDELKWMTTHEIADKFYALNTDTVSLENWSDKIFKEFFIN